MEKEEEEGKGGRKEEVNKEQVKEGRDKREGIKQEERGEWEISKKK